MVGDGDKSIGLRVDFEVPPIREVSHLDDESQVEGVSRLRGHDSHTSMLLGAGKHLLGRMPTGSWRGPLSHPYAG